MEPTTIWNGDVTVKRTPNHVYYVTYGELTPQSKYMVSQGVTGVLEELYDQRALIDWASGMAAKEIVLTLAGEKHAQWLDKAFLALYNGELPSVPQSARDIAVEPMTGQDLLYIYQQGLDAYKKKAQYGKDVGTQVHDAIDRWHKEGISSIEPSGDQDQDAVALESFENYKKWFNKSGLTIFMSERVIHSKKYNYCGQLDRIYKDKNGNLLLGDFKTSNISKSCPTGIREQYWSQVGAYTQAFEEETGLKITDLIITNSPKNGKVKVLRASTLGITPTYAKRIWLEDLAAARNHKNLKKMMKGVKSET